MIFLAQFCDAARGLRDAGNALATGGGRNKSCIHLRDSIMVTKPNAVAITALLAALATPNVAIPAFARDNQTPTWDACYTLAVERGSGPDKGGGDKVLSQYKAFMDQCLAGKIPVGADASASVGTSPARARASR
jgi:hypothetical protein